MDFTDNRTINEKAINVRRGLKEEGCAKYSYPHEEVTTEPMCKATFPINKEPKITNDLVSIAGEANRLTGLINELDTLFFEKKEAIYKQIAQLEKLVKDLKL